MKYAFRSGILAIDTYLQIKNFRAGTSAGNYHPLLEGGVGAYQVPTGKVLIITEIHIAGAAAAVGLDIGYGDVQAGGGGAAPAGNQIMISDMKFATANSVYHFPMFIKIPALKWPWARYSGATCYFNGIGIELTEE